MKSDQQPGFIFYLHWWREYFSDLDDVTQLEIFRAIVFFAENGSLPENLSRDAKLIMRPICGDITRNQEKRAKIIELRKSVGKLGGRPRKQQESQKPNDSEENQKNQKVISETKKTYTETETEAVTVTGNNNKKNIDKKKELVKYGQRIAMTEEEHAKLCEEFGTAETQEALATADDWLLSKGKVQKDYAAFMRNWLRRNAARNRIDMRRNAPKQIAPIDYENSVARLRAEGFDVIEA